MAVRLVGCLAALVAVHMHANGMEDLDSNNSTPTSPPSQSTSSARVSSIAQLQAALANGTGYISLVEHLESADAASFTVLPSTQAIIVRLCATRHLRRCDQSLLHIVPDVLSYSVQGRHILCGIVTTSMVTHALRGPAKITAAHCAQGSCSKAPPSRLAAPSGCLRPGQCVIRIAGRTDDALFNAHHDRASSTRKSPVDTDRAPEYSYGLWLHNLHVHGDAAGLMATAITKQPAAAPGQPSTALWLTAVTFQSWRTSLNVSGTTYAEGTPLALVA